MKHMLCENIDSYNTITASAGRQEKIDFMEPIYK